MTDLDQTLAAIDAVTAPHCGGCGRRLRDNGPSLDFCSEWCQESWTSGFQTTRPVLRWPIDAVTAIAQSFEAAGRAAARCDCSVLPQLEGLHSTQVFIAPAGTSAPVDGRLDGWTPVCVTTPADAEPQPVVDVAEVEQWVTEHVAEPEPWQRGWLRRALAWVVGGGR